MNFLFDLLRRTEREPQLLSPEEMAIQIRRSILDMFHYGVVGSDIEIPHQQEAASTKLPLLLRYSAETKRHFGSLRGILAAPREFQVVSHVDDPWQGDTAHGDVIYSQEGKNHVFEFANDLTFPYLNSFMRALASHKERVTLYVSIIFLATKDNTWIVKYSYNNFDSPNNNIGPAAQRYYPDRVPLLNFYLSPHSLSASWFIKNMTLPKNTRASISPIGREQVDKYLTLNFRYEVERHKAILERKYGERKDPSGEGGSRDFSIVQLGKVAIGNKIYFIYTGSEQPLLKVREKKPKPLTQLQSAPVSISAN